MDLTRPVIYRGLFLNETTLDADIPIRGFQIDSADYSDVLGVGYTEKRSMADGFDVSDIFLGARRVELQGTVYGGSRAGMFDRLAQLRYALSPTAALADEPGDFGYLPLDFEVTTNDTRWDVDPSTGLRYIPQCLRVRPSRLPRWTVVRDRLGGDPAKGAAMQWQAVLDARDPRVYAQTEIDYTAWVGTTTGGSTFYNRGNYPAPLDILLFAPGGAATSKLNLVIGGSNMHLTMPASGSDQILRYDGGKKVVTLAVGTTVTLRMDLLSFTAGTTHPLIGAGANPFTYSRTSGAVNIGAGSHMWFWESWA